MAGTRRSHTWRSHAATISGCSYFRLQPVQGTASSGYCNFWLQLIESSGCSYFQHQPIPGTASSGYRESRIQQIPVTSSPGPNKFRLQRVLAMTDPETSPCCNQIRRGLATVQKVGEVDIDEAMCHCLHNIFGTSLVGLTRASVARSSQQALCLLIILQWQCMNQSLSLLVHNRN